MFFVLIDTLTNRRTSAEFHKRGEDKVAESDLMLLRWEGMGLWQ